LATDRGVERAREPRFPVAVPIIYRHAYEQQWHQGTTVNVSGKGALFVGPLNLWAGAPVELRLALASSAPGVAPDQFVGTGRIVRVDGAAEPSGAMMAAQFDDFRFDDSVTPS
jgi:hypothetical protein